MNATHGRAALARDAVDVPRRTLGELAELYKMSESSLEKYRLQARVPSTRTLVRMSEGLRIFAREMLILREKIEKEVRDAEGEDRSGPDGVRVSLD